MSRRKILAPMRESTKGQIGRRIRELRGFELTQKQFGKKLAISQSMVSRLEKGEIPSVELLLRISEVCRKSTDWILKGKD